jgi:hypothetical protein
MGMDVLQFCSGLAGAVSTVNPCRHRMPVQLARPADRA